MCASAVSIRGERAVARNRRARGDEREPRQRFPVLVDMDVVRKPEQSRVAQGRVGARDVEIARPEQRKLDVLHGFEGRAHEELQRGHPRASR